MQQEEKIGMHDKQRDKGHCLVPGFASETWNEIEKASLILGLYIFGKNLVQVKRFIGNKKMGDILSFYYGKFYKSDKYQRQSGRREMRSRKCIYEQKIFSVPRQQELLSRLLPNVSENATGSLGLKALIEGVGVGKGKEDLTGLTAESMKLSKARTSDLFWEAVWPRLLARGWHFEQPDSHNYAVASKHSLVFLVHGVKKFSRKLVMGNHYFDSVSDVLGKVAYDPELVELETNAGNDCTSKDENGWIKETKLDHENSPDQPRHCYLKVKTPNRSTDVMKFTIVDTSLANEKMTKERRRNRASST
ncbi:hypothetical protein VNO77_27264 [Canavalia gladiata]|uniref:SANT domain-containing protein n=1 Tax=Canavalia gladiata TaxID=3824 RepID=A0AAN9KWX0_CANGL